MNGPVNVPSADAPVTSVNGMTGDVGPIGYVPYGKELTKSWAELQARIKKGDFSGIYIGDYKTITLTTGETVVCEVAGIDTYYNCCGTANIVPHHMDFISRDCLADPHRYNKTNTNNGTAEENPPGEPLSCSRC